MQVHALPLTFLTYMESVSVATKFANLNRYALDMTQAGHGRTTVLPR